MKQFCDFGSFLCCWVATRKHLVSRFWLPPTVVWRTRRPHTPHQERASILLAAVACEELWLSASKVQTFSWGLFLSHFVYPQNSSSFDHCSTSTSRCRPLLRTCGRPIWRESHALWMQHSWKSLSICKIRTSGRCKRSVLNMAATVCFCSNKSSRD